MFSSNLKVKAIQKGLAMLSHYSFEGEKQDEKYFNNSLVYQ